MPDFPLNQNLPPGYKVPGIYTSVILGDPGGPAPNNRVLCFGYMRTSGNASPNAPFLGITQEQVDQAVGSNSIAALSFMASKSQLPQGVGAEVWILPLLEPIAGVSATHLIQFLAAPQSGILGTNTSALASSVCDIYIANRKASFLIQTGDTFAQIAAKANAALSLMSRLPVTSSVAGDTITLTDVHKGEHGNDLPIRVDIANPACGIAASPGSVSFAGNAGGDGSVTLQLGVRSAQAVIKSGNTPDKSATALRDAINQDAYACTAAIPSTATAQVTLFYRNERVVHRISASASAPVTPQTVSTSVGVLGTGTPDLTKALANLTGDANAYAAWSCFFTDAQNWGLVLAHIEGQSVSPIEKGQVVHGCLTTGLPSDPSTGLTLSTNPVLTSSERPVINWCPGSPNRAFELCARTAALVAAHGVRNYNGDTLETNDSNPLGVPHRADRPTLDQINIAITTFFYTPIVPNSDNKNSIIRSTTTYKPKGTVDEKFTKWSHVLNTDLLRAGLRLRLASLFSNKQLKVNSKARTSRATTPDAIREAVFVYIKEQDALDLFDGADGAREAILTGILVSPTRVDVALPFRIPADLDQISIVGIQQ